VRVLVFGTYDVKAHPRVGVLAAGLRGHGMRVEECNEPLGIDTAGRVAILRRPWLLPWLALRIVRCWIALALRARRMPAPDVVLVGYLGHFDVLLARRLFRRTPIVLDHLISAADTARDRGERGGIKQALLAWLDGAALGAADVVVVDTDEHRDLLPDRFQEKAVVVAVGAPETWFSAGETKIAESPGEIEANTAGPGTDPLRVAFFGLYTPLQGAAVIGQALSELANEQVEVTMIGRGQDRQAAEAAAASNQRVRWLDWVPADELPAIVAGHHVCLGVFGTGPKALRVVPNKVFQGAAAGCAIVTSDTAPQRRVLGDAAAYVPPGDAGALAKLLARLAHDRGELARLRAAAGTLARNRFSPDQVATPLVDRLCQPTKSPATKPEESS
jgi:glycosyltransferase involved in cell wall biosynthesis